MSNKEEKVAIAGSASGIMTGVGIGLMFLGPIGMVAGGIVLGAGISGGVNTIQQGVSDKEDFEFGDWGKGVGIGAAGGAIAAPFAVVGGIASAGMGTAAKVVTQIAVGTAGGTAAGGGTKVIQNACEGKDLEDGVGTALITGALSGGIGAGCGQAASGVAKVFTQGATEVGKEVTRNAAIRIASQTVGGATGGCVGGSVGKLVENALNKGEISRDALLKYLLETCQISSFKFEALWSYFKTQGLTNGQIVTLPEILRLPEEFKQYQSFINALLPSLHDLTKGIGQAAAMGAAIGGVSSAISSIASEQINKAQLKQELVKKAEAIGKNGQQGSTLDSKVLAQKTGRTVVTHTKDGKVIAPADNKVSSRAINNHFEDGHYRPANRNGDMMKVPTDVKNDGNCFYEHAKGQLGVKTTQQARQQLSEFAKNEPFQAFKYAKVEEVKAGGYLQGGGFQVGKNPNRPNLTMDNTPGAHGSKFELKNIEHELTSNFDIDPQSFSEQGKRLVSFIKNDRFVARLRDGVHNGGADPRTHVTIEVHHKLPNGNIDFANRVETFHVPCDQTQGIWHIGSATGITGNRN